MTEDELRCEECGLIYQVIWNNDGTGDAVQYCPRCAEPEPRLTSDDKPTKPYKWADDGDPGRYTL